MMQAILNNCFFAIYNAENQYYCSKINFIGGKNPVYDFDVK